MEDFTAFNKNTENDDDFAITNYFIENLSPNKALATNASSLPISINNTGTGNNVLSSAPIISALNVETSSPSIYALSSVSIPSISHGSISIASPNLLNVRSATMFLGKSETTNNGMYLSWNNVTTGSALNYYSLRVVGQTSSMDFAAGITYHQVDSIFVSNVQINALTASTAVALNGSKQLISVTNTGTGNNVLATSPTLVTPTLGAATGTSLAVSGFITGGSLNLTGLTSNRAIFTDGSKGLVSKVGFSYASYFSSGSTPVPNNTWTTIGSLTSNGTGGTGVLSPQSSTASFANSFTVPLLFVITFTSRPVGTGIANWAARILINNDEPLSQYEGASGRNEVCISCTGVLQPLGLLKCQVNQYTGFGQNAEGIRICITTYPI